MVKNGKAAKTNMAKGGNAKAGSKSPPKLAQNTLLAHFMKKTPTPKVPSEIPEDKV